MLRTRDAPFKAKGLAISPGKELLCTNNPFHKTNRYISTVISLSTAIDENRVCFEIQGEKHCLLGIESQVVKPGKAAALVSSIACKRGKKNVVRWSMKRRIKSITIAIQFDVIHCILHVQVGHCYFVEDEHAVPHQRYCVLIGPFRNFHLEICLIRSI